MQKEIVVNVSPNEVRVGLLEDRQLVEVSMERADSKRVVGNVYKGVVTAVKPGLQAAFVDIGMEKAGFLHVSDLVHDESKEDDRGGRRGPRRGRRDNLRSIETMLKEKDEILVQVTKEVIGTKGPRLTADISLPGRFLVMMPMGSHVGVSRKIDDRRERGRLRELLDRLKPEGPGAYIIRTAGSGISEKMLQQDMEYLSGLWSAVSEREKQQAAPSLVHEDVGMIVGLVRDIFKEDVQALHLDDREEYDRLLRYVKTFAPEMKNRIHLYRGSTPIFDKFGIEAEIKRTLDKKVWLNRGGFLVIEQTEALVSIDVNTGRYTGKKNQEETILRTNLAAAREIPRQLRLRDIGGIIVIDFIDMESEGDKRKVLNELRTYLRHDRARHKTFQISELGLIEMSRQRVRESLRDQMSDDCIFCRGSGKVLSIETLSNKVERLLDKVPLVSKDRAILVQASPTLAIELQTARYEAVKAIAKSAGVKVDIVEDSRLHREEFKIIALESRTDLVALLEEGAKRAASRPRRVEPVAAETPAPRRGRRSEEESDRERGEGRDRRGRRGGRRRGERPREDDRVARTEEAPREREEAAPVRRRREAEVPAEEGNGGARRRRRRRGRRGRGGRGTTDTRQSERSDSAPRESSSPSQAQRSRPASRGSQEEPKAAGTESQAGEATPQRREIPAPGGSRRGRRGRGGRSRREEGGAESRPPSENVEAREERAPRRERAPREETAPREERPRSERPAVERAAGNSDEAEHRRPHRRTRRAKRGGSASNERESKPSPPQNETPREREQPAPAAAQSNTAPTGDGAGDARPRARRRRRRTRKPTRPGSDDKKTTEGRAAPTLLEAKAGEPDFGQN